MIGRCSFAPGRQADGTNASMRPHRVLLAAAGLFACGSEPVAADSTAGGSSSTAVTDGATSPEPTTTGGGVPGEWGGILGPEIWFTDDERRLMVRMETHVVFGTISLQLREFSQGATP